MKLIKNISLVVVAALLAVTACKKTEVETEKEIALIDYEYNQDFVFDGALTKQERNVLIQEFTGVYCYTCPMAHEITEELIADHPQAIVPINIHSHFFSIYGDPNVMGNEFDFRTTNGDSIVSLLGGVISLPSASFDMSTQPGEDAAVSFQRVLGQITSQIA